MQPVATASATAPPHQDGRKRRPLVAVRVTAQNRATKLGERAVLFKFAVVLMLLLVIGSLFSGLFFLYRDKGAGDRVVRALTLRISLSLLLFVALLLSYRFGPYSQ
jgi:hypothetical protein